MLVTAKGMEGKVVEVMDKDRIFDDVSGLVQRRFSVEMDSTQFFVTHQKWFSSQLLSMYSGNHYGVPAGSVWPPWVPMEVMFDFQAQSREISIVERCGRLHHKIILKPSSSNYAELPCEFFFESCVNVR